MRIILFDSGQGVFPNFFREFSSSNLNEKKHFNYVRYNTELIKNTIDKYKIEDIADNVIESLTEMDRSENVDVLIKIGSKIATSEIKPGNFPDNFNIKELYDEEIQKRNGTGTGL